MEHLVFDFQPLIPIIFAFVIIEVLKVTGVNIIICVDILLLFLDLFLFLLSPHRLLAFDEEGVLAAKFNLK